MKILLVSPPWSDTYSSYKAAAKLASLYPPLGLCYLASYILNKRPADEILIIDAEAESMDISAVIEKAKDFSPDIIGISSQTPIFHKVKILATRLKENLNPLIIVGGPHVSVMPREAMQECPAIDFCVIGEGEETFVELLEAMKKKTPFAAIKGLVFRQKEEIIINPKRELINDLQAIPMPKRNLLKLDKYKWSVPGKGFVKFTTILASRGCPFQCIFCSARNVFGSTVRMRDVFKVVDEIEYLIQSEGINHFFFVDDTLTLNKDWINTMCKEIELRGLKFTFEGFTRANTITEEMLKTMKKAGLVRISLGIESGNPEILKKIKKGITLEQITKAFQSAKRVGIEAWGSAVIGFPYETKESVMQTLLFLKNLTACDQVYLSIATPYPGTELYEMAINGQGGIKLLTRDFSEYKRYGGPVMEVNDLTKDDLIKLQKKGFRMFYFTPRRIFYNLKRAGFKAGITNAIAFIKSVYGK